VTFGEFEAELAEPRPGATYSVKALFDEAGAVEHLWLSELSVENGVLTGTIDNEPIQLSRVRFGDRVEVDRDLVSDWMVIEDGRYRGGFTVRVLRDRMAPTQRKELDRVMGASPAEPAGSS
jgi:uncharacterized protein YegJ (DUF2314 family)